MRNNLALTKQLIPLGLDIHTVDSLGKSALHYTLNHYQSQEMFDFLLANGVSVEPLAKGFDLLDLALQRTSNNMDGVYYVQKLIKSHAPITSSHKELLQTKYAKIGTQTSFGS